MSVKYYRPLNRSIAGLVASWTDLVLPSVADAGHSTEDSSWECSVKVDTTTENVGFTHKLSGAGTLISELNGWTYQACQDIIQMLEMTNPRDLSLFAVPRKILDICTVLESNSVLGAYGENNLGVRYPAIKGHRKDAHKYLNSNSILYATSESPVWYMDSNKIFIAPSQAATMTFYVETVDYPTKAMYWSNSLDNSLAYNETYYTMSNSKGGEVTKNLEVVDHYIVMANSTEADEVNDIVGEDLFDIGYDRTLRVPEKYNVAIALFVAIELMRYRKRVLWDKLPPVKDYTQNTVDDSSYTYSDALEASDGWEKVRWYIEKDEDSELTQIKIASLNGEQQKFVLDYQWYQNTEAELVQKYQQFFSIETQKKDS